VYYPKLHVSLSYRVRCFFNYLYNVIKAVPISCRLLISGARFRAKLIPVGFVAGQSNIWTSFLLSVSFHLCSIPFHVPPVRWTLGPWRPQFYWDITWLQRNNNVKALWRCKHSSWLLLLEVSWSIIALFIGFHDVFESKEAVLHLMGQWAELRALPSKN
jgi:hypothetical protein